MQPVLPGKASSIVQAQDLVITFAYQEMMGSIKVVFTAASCIIVIYFVQCWHGCLALAKQQREMRRRLGRQAVALAKAEAVVGRAVWWKELGAITKSRKEHVISPSPDSQILPCSNSPTSVSLTHVPSPKCTQEQQTKCQKPCWESRPSEPAQDFQGTEWNYFKSRSQLRCWDEKQHFTWDRYADTGFYYLILQ